MEQRTKAKLLVALTNSKGHMETEFTPETAIKNLMIGAAPERRVEIDELWKRYAPTVQIATTRQGFTVEAEKQVIRFDQKSLQAVWLIGFAAWHSIEAYAPAILVSGWTHTTIESTLNNDLEIGKYESEFKARLKLAASFLESKDSKNSWPVDIPLPEGDREQLKGNQNKATFDLVCMAAAYVFLHEFRHVMFLQDETTPKDRREEEMQCDVWARSFLTEQIGCYVKSNNSSFQEVNQKRQMALALGAFILHQITPENIRWGTHEYPSIKERIEALIGGSSLSEDSHFWVFAAGLLVGIMRQSHRSLDIIPTGSKALVATLIDSQ